MIKIYTSPNCLSCKKAKEYLNTNNIPYEEINILTTKITKEELKEILVLTTNGSDDIISLRSNVIKKENPDIDSMSISELIQYIIDNPTILKRPIIIDKEILQVGYNKEDIKIFNHTKEKIQSYCPVDKCPNFTNCNSTYAKVLLEASKDDN